MKAMWLLLLLVVLWMSKVSAADLPGDLLRILPLGLFG